AAAAIAAVHPLLWINDGMLLSEAVYAPLVALALVLTYWFRDGPSPRRAAALGFVVMLAAHTRAEAMVLVPMLVLPAVLGLRRRRERSAVRALERLPEHEVRPPGPDDRRVGGRAPRVGLRRALLRGRARPLHLLPGRRGDPARRRRGGARRARARRRDRVPPGSRPAPPGGGGGPRAADVGPLRRAGEPEHEHRGRGPRAAPQPHRPVDLLRAPAAGRRRRGVDAAPPPPGLAAAHGGRHGHDHGRAHLRADPLSGAGRRDARGPRRGGARRDHPVGPGPTGGTARRRRSPALRCSAGLSPDRPGRSASATAAAQHPVAQGPPADEQEGLHHDAPRHLRRAEAALAEADRDLG